jgi:putative ABC transport system permease protein
MAVRVAVGADRRRLVRQLLTESAILALAGCLCGIALAAFGVRALVAIAPPQSPRLDDVRLDAAVLAFTATITALAAVIAGVAPAATAWSASLMADLREGARETRAFTRTRSIVVVTQVAAAMTLVVGTGLFVRSLVALQRVDLGFRADRVLTASVSPPRGMYRGDDAVRGLYDRMLARASTLPGVDSASMTSVLPLSGAQINFNFRIEDGRRP